jgi:histone-lysine N-methyltransferase SETD3
LAPGGAPAAPSEEARIDAFAEWWARQDGCEHGAVTLQNYAAEMRGVHATADLAKGDIVVSVARRWLLTSERGRATAFGRAVEAAVPPLPLAAREEVHLALFLLTDMADPCSPYRAYYDVLPPTLFSIPVFWREEELEWLRGSLFLPELRRKRAMLEAEYATLCAGLDGAPATAGLGFGAAVSEQYYLWARALVGSRNFGLAVGGVPMHVMAPYADMFNHTEPGPDFAGGSTNAGGGGSKGAKGAKGAKGGDAGAAAAAEGPPRAVFDYEEELGALTVRAQGAIARGAEVCFSYGTKSNGQLLKSYGFALEGDRECNEFTVRFDVAAVGGGAGGAADAARAAALGARSATVAELRALRPVIGVDVRSTATLQVFAALRVLSSNEADLRQMLAAPGASAPASSARGGRLRHSLGMAPCNLRNEVAMMTALRALMGAMLGDFPRTLAQDEADLAGGDPAAAPFSNRRHALLVLRGEKRLMAFYEAFAAKCLGVLALEGAAERSAAAGALAKQRHGGDPAAAAACKHLNEQLGEMIKLPKPCAVCALPFAWQKKWEHSWDEITTCSKACQTAQRRQEKQAALAAKR